MTVNILECARKSGSKILLCQPDRKFNPSYFGTIFSSLQLHENPGRLCVVQKDRTKGEGLLICGVPGSPLIVPLFNVGFG